MRLNVAETSKPGQDRFERALIWSILYRMSLAKIERRTSSVGVMNLRRCSHVCFWNTCRPIAMEGPRNIGRRFAPINPEFEFDDRCDEIPCSLGRVATGAARHEGTSVNEGT